MKLKKSCLLRAILFFFLESIARLSFAAYYSNTNLQTLSQTMPPDKLTSWESTRSNFYMSLLGGASLVPELNASILFYSDYSQVDVGNDFRTGFDGALGLVNVFYDFNNPEGFYPYLGLGYGAFLRNLSLVTGQNPQNQHNYTASKTTWVVQGTLGMGFKINRNFSFVLDYRHLFVPTVSVKYTNKAETLSFSEHEPYSANLFNLGFTINF